MTTNDNEMINIQYTLGLDKLALTVSPKILCQYSEEFLKFLKSCTYVDSAAFFSALAQYGYRVAIRVQIDSLPPEAWPVLQAGPYDKSKPFFRLEFNPNRLGTEGIESLKQFIDGNTPDGWPLFLAGARASRIDVNVDAAGLPLNRVLARSCYPRYTECWRNTGQADSFEFGEPQTVYLGNKSKSKAIFRVYDLAPSKLSSGHSCATRFESMDRKTRPNLSDLHEYKFPFAKLVVRSTLAPKPPGWTEGHWRMFVRFAGDHGLNVARKHLTVTERKAADTALSAWPISGLDLKALWAQWPVLITNFGLVKPGTDGGFMPGYNDEKLAA